MKVLDLIKAWWWAGCLLLAVVIFVVDTRATGETVKKHDDAFAQIAQMAKNERDPNKLLYDYLLLHNNDSLVAKVWSVLPKGAVKDKNGKPVVGVSFLDLEQLPERGVMKMYHTPDSVVVQTVLWDYLSKEKK